MTRAGRRTVRQTAAANTRAAAAVGEGVAVLTEAQWQNRVAGLASFYGWLRYHPADNVPSTTIGQLDRIMRATPPPRTAVQLAGMLRRKARRANIEPGFPDWVFARHDDFPELVFVELKTDVGRVSADQERWLEVLRALAAASETNGLGLEVAEPGAAASLRVEAHVWRPAQEDEVHARLARGRVLQPTTW